MPRNLFVLANSSEEDWKWSVERWSNGRHRLGDANVNRAIEDWVTKVIYVCYVQNILRGPKSAFHTFLSLIYRKGKFYFHKFWFGTIQKIMGLYVVLYADFMISRRLFK